MSVFNQIPESDYIYTSKSFFVIKDAYPVSPGHLLIISKALKTDFFELSEKEQQELTKMITFCKTYLERHYQPDGYNIGMNCGKSAGQTVMHFHCHVIPRYEGDMTKPEGGIRHCINGKGYY